MINLHPSYLNNPLQTVMFLKDTVAILHLTVTLFTVVTVYLWHCVCGTAMLQGKNVLSPSCLLYFEKVEHK